MSTRRRRGLKPVASWSNMASSDTSDTDDTDHQPEPPEPDKPPHTTGEQKVAKVVKRLVFGTMLMITTSLIILSGHAATLALVQFVQVMIFHELVKVRYNHRRVRDLPLFRTTQWGWFITCMVYSYGRFFLEEHRYPLIVGAGELSRGSDLRSLLGAPLRTIWAHACWLLSKVPPARCASPAARPRLEPPLCRRLLSVHAGGAAGAAVHRPHLARDVLGAAHDLRLHPQARLLQAPPPRARHGGRALAPWCSASVLAGTRWASWRGRSPRS